MWEIVFKVRHGEPGWAETDEVVYKSSCEPTAQQIEEFEEDICRKKEYVRSITIYRITEITRLL